MFSVGRLLSRRCHSISSILGCTPAPLRTGQADFPYIRLLAESFSPHALRYDRRAATGPPGGDVGDDVREDTSVDALVGRLAYPCRITTGPRSLHSVDGSPRTGDSYVGTFAPRGLAASSLGHCSTPVPITRDGAIPASSFHIGRGYSGTHEELLPKSREPSLAWLLACLRAARCCLGPRGAGFALVPTALAAWPAPAWKGSAPTNMKGSRGYGSDSGHTPFTSLLSRVLLSASADCRNATERLTRPYSGGPPRYAGSPVTGNHCQVAFE